MNERTIWIVRVVAFLIFLFMMILLLNLYTKLVKLREQQEAPGPVPQKTSKLRDVSRPATPGYLVGDRA